MPAEGRIIILLVTVITAIAALFCVIGLATKGWAGGSVGLFCNECPKTPAALSVISFILLIVSVLAFLLLLFGVLNNFLRFIPIILLFIATIFLLSTFASYLTAGLGYSYDLMVVAHFFSYIALAASAYWLGHSDASSSN